MMVLVGGYILDLILGDPQGFPHPVRFIGGLINKLEKLLYRSEQSKGLLLRGGILTLLVVSITYFITFGVIGLAALLHPVAGTIVSIILAYTIPAT